jgi:hypothetical protein
MKLHDKIRERGQSDNSLTGTGRERGQERGQSDNSLIDSAGVAR